jgi:hypothetical protein
VGAGCSCCPKCGTTYEGVGGGPKTAAAVGQPAVVLPAALGSPEAALAALTELVDKGQCKVAEVKTTDPYRTAVAGLTAATNAAQKAANQLNHTKLLKRQAEEKVVNLGIKVEQFMGECAVLDAEVVKARRAYEELDKQLKAGPAVGPSAQQHEDVIMADGDRFAKMEARCNELLAANAHLLEELKKLAKGGQPTAAAAASASVAAAVPVPVDGGPILVQQPANTVFEPGWCTGSLGLGLGASSAAAAGAGGVTAAATPTPGTKHKRGDSEYHSDPGSENSKADSRRERFLGTAYAPAFAKGRRAAAEEEIDGDTAIRKAEQTRENIRVAMAGGPADAGRPPSSG